MLILSKSNFDMDLNIDQVDEVLYFKTKSENLIIIMKKIIFTYIIHY